MNKIIASNQGDIDAGAKLFNKTAPKVIERKSSGVINFLYKLVFGTNETHKQPDPKNVRATSSLEENKLTHARLTPKHIEIEAEIQIEDPENKAVEEDEPEIYGKIKNTEETEVDNLFETNDSVAPSHTVKTRRKFTAIKRGVLTPTTFKLPRLDCVMSNQHVNDSDLLARWFNKPVVTEWTPKSRNHR